MVSCRKPPLLQPSSPIGQAPRPELRPKSKLSLSRVSALVALPGWWAAASPWLPVEAWFVDLPASFAVQAMTGLAILALLQVFCRRPLQATLLAAGSVLAASSVLPTWVAAGRATTQTGIPCKLLALNLLFTLDDPGSPDGARAQAQALELLAARDPDLVLCSELTPGWRRALATVLERYPHRCEAPAAGPFGIGLYSRFPLAESAVVPLGFSWAPAIRAVVQSPGGTLGLLGVHTPRPGLGQHCAERDAALAAIPAALAQLPRPWCVVGDCNATAQNRAFGRLLAATGLCDAGCAPFAGTWNASWPAPLRVAIDHILVDTVAGLGVAEVAVGPEFGSDHLPLVAELRLGGAAAGSGGTPERK